jgi:hypothetical protein
MITPVNAILAALLAVALALHSDTLLYLIGPAGCMILIPALVIAVSVAAMTGPRARRTIAPVEREPASPRPLPPAPMSSVIAARIAYSERLTLTETLAPDGTRQRSLTVEGWPPS